MKHWITDGQQTGPKGWLETVCVRKNQSAAAPQCGGGSVGTKANFGLKALLGTLTVMSLWFSGCGGGSSNVLTVTVTDSLGGIVVVTQADTITATVTGPDLVNGVADVNVKFSCSYTTTTVNGTTTTTSKPIDCATPGAVIGTFSNVQP